MEALRMLGRHWEIVCMRRCVEALERAATPSLRPIFTRARQETPIREAS